MTDTYLIRLPWPDSRLSTHAKGHWRPKAKATKAARGAACTVARATGLRAAMDRPTLEFTFYPPDRRRRDLHNMQGMCKAYIDGIADAMGMDDHGFRCVFPDRFEDPIKGGAVLITVKKET